MLRTVVNRCRNQCQQLVGKSSGHFLASSAGTRWAADTAYGSGGMLAWLIEHGIESHISVLDRVAQTNTTHLMTANATGSCNSFAKI
jgi:hypothetical protein